MALCHETLMNYYKMNFALMKYHGYSSTELEEMLPFERDVYVMLLVDYLEKEKERKRSASNV